MNALEGVVLVALPALIFVGSVCFLLLYRPLNPRKHSPAGRHLQLMALAILVIFGLETLATLLYNFGVLQHSGWRAVLIESTAYGFMTFVVWQRVFMVIKHRSDKTGEEEERNN